MYYIISNGKIVSWLKVLPPAIDQQLIWQNGFYPIFSFKQKFIL